MAPATNRPPFNVCHLFFGRVMHVNSPTGRYRKHSPTSIYTVKSTTYIPTGGYRSDYTNQYKHPYGRYRKHCIYEIKRIFRNPV
jgi:hypothetical protein